jgi:DNA repair protein RecN (Recombination protein N)
MLRELRVRDFAVIDAVTVPFVPGLNVLTGETGAGKSLLIDALLLLRGARAQTDVIRAGADSAAVEARFEDDGDRRALAILEEAGLAPDDGQILVRRELTRAGRHRAFVNDSPVTVGLLERLGDHLVDVHGQHEHQRLLEPAHQLAVLDRFADTDGLREQVSELWAKYRAAKEALEQGRAAGRDRAQREDTLRFQVSELDAARLQVGEEEALRAERRRLQHAERLVAGLAEAEGLLDGEGTSAAVALGRAVRVLGDLGRIDPAFTAPAEALDAARAQIDDAVTTLRRLRDDLVMEPGRLEAIDDRLHALTRLRRKYGDSEEAMLRFRDEAAAELERVADHDEQLVLQERALESVRLELAAAADALATRRGAAAARLAPRVERELTGLGMEHAMFRIAHERVDLDTMSARGLDRVEFRLSTNPGEEPKPLARVASGGELSRTMLALTAVLARAHQAGTMIFDEVDAGIGGRVAAVVAQKLATVAEGRQVLCVTHLAAIAARADHHVRVAKTIRAGRTRVSVGALGGDTRVREVARMLGGDAVTPTALGHARELLGGRI